MADKDLIVAVGNVYLDTNIFGVDSKDQNIMEEGKEYFAESSETVLGGSSVNFLLQAKQLDSQVAFIGQVGNDEHGERITTLLKDKGVLTDLLVSSETESTSLATNIVLKHNGGFIGLHWGSASRNLKPEQIDTSSQLFSKAKAMYFGGTAKQEFIFNKFPEILKELQGKQIKTFADPNRFPPHTQDKDREILLSSFPFIDCYLPNEEELLNATGKNSIDEALELVFEKGATMVVVKKGKEGCRIKTNTEDITVPGFQVSAITTVGAGDSFNAGFITQLLAGKSLEECGRFANAVAALKVSKNMHAANTEVEDFLHLNK